MVRNLQELAACAFPYIIPLFPCSLPIELIEGEHFVLADLCKSSPSSSSKAVAAQEDPAEATTGTLAGLVQIKQPQRPRPASQPGKKEWVRKRTRQTTVANVGLEGFMDWAGVLASESVEEEEMSMLVAGFAARMRNRDADLEDEPTPIPNGMCPKRSSPNVEAEKEWEIILMDSPDQASNDQPILEGAPNDDKAPQEGGILVGVPSVDEIGEGSPSGVDAGPLPPLKPTSTVPNKRRPS